MCSVTILVRDRTRKVGPQVWDRLQAALQPKLRHERCLTAVTSSSYTNIQYSWYSDVSQPLPDHFTKHSAQLIQRCLTAFTSSFYINNHYSWYSDVLPPLQVHPTRTISTADTAMSHRPYQFILHKHLVQLIQQCLTDVTSSSYTFSTADTAQWYDRTPNQPLLPSESSSSKFGKANVKCQNQRLIKGTGS